MYRFTQRSGNNEHGSNYLASVSDLMAGLLFIFVILVVFAVHSMSVKERQIEQIRNHLAGNDIALRDLLVRLHEELQIAYVPVEIDETNGILRIPEESLTFATGKADLSLEAKEVLSTVRKILEKELVCYSKGHELRKCVHKNPHGHTLDAVFIEGHTDNQPYGGDRTGTKNRRLSTDRANAVYEALLFKEGILYSFKNPAGESLFSLSGYGADRPVPGHVHKRPTDDPMNRRIELRFIMTAPTLE